MVALSSGIKKRQNEGINIDLWYNIALRKKNNTGFQVNSVADNFKVTWHEASDDCKKKGTNLASFHSDDQFHAVLQKIE